MTSAQICTRASAIAKLQGATATAGLYLNAVLSELCQNYDFELARNYFSFSLTSSVSSPQFPNNQSGAGPFNLPADYLRVPPGEFLWYLNGVPYTMVAVDMAEYDALVQQAGWQNYPSLFATAMDASPPVCVIWPPMVGTQTALIRYFCQMKDIGSGNVQQTPIWNPGTLAPQLATVVPWFPDQNFLITRVAGEMMKETSDSRWEKFLGDGDSGAQGILSRYLKMKDDSEDRAQTVKKDPRRFGRTFDRLKSTKQYFW